jgi:hypothetical protein
MVQFVEFNNSWHKECSKCKKAYGAFKKSGILDFFFNDNSRADGFSNNCKNCYKEKESKRIRTNRYAHTKRSTLRYPEKHEARIKLNNAVRVGKIIKSSHCQHCGEETKTQGHHVDYSKPLDVLWLCPKCHGRQHRLERNL